MTEKKSEKSVNDPLIAERVALLKYYNSQCMTHGAFMISLIVGASVLISRWDVFSPNLLPFFFTMVVGIAVLLIYVLGRTLYWGKLATHVITIDLSHPRKDEKELIVNLQSQHIPSMNILQQVTIHRAKRSSKVCRSFGEPKRMWLMLFLIFVVVYIIVVETYFLYTLLQT